MSSQARLQEQIKNQKMVSGIKPRPVFCLIEDLYSNRMVAENACLGRFTHIGVTLEPGTEPDWLNAKLIDDEEWRIEWSKFYYGLDLAAAYAETKDRKFLTAWEKLVLSWIRQVPYNHDVSDVIGRRIQNWIYAWTRFASAPHFDGLTPGFELQILESLRQQIRHLRAHLNEARNHRTLELYALFVAALALPQIASHDLLKFAISELHANLLNDVREDGVHCEHSTHYHMLVLRSYVAAFENARRFGVNFPPAYDERLEKACEFAMHFHRPDGQIPALSDSDSGNYADLLAHAARLLNRPDFLYAATVGTQGVAPVRRNVSFLEGGYHIQRSGWGNRETPFRQERFLVFDCGALGDGGHGHYDLLNIEVSAGGQPLIVDPGRYTYAEQTPNLRHWFKGTAAHNTVCVDGKDQTAYYRGKPKGKLPEARFVERWSSPGFDMLCGVARSAEYEAVHTRRIFFLGDEYWIIHDRLRGAQPHRYDLRFHLAAAAWEKTSISICENQTRVCAPGMALVFDAGKVATIEPGWVAPLYGIKHPAPVVSVVSNGAASADFITLIAPTTSRDCLPKFSACLDRGDASDAISVEVSGLGPNGLVKDHLTWSSAIARHDVGPFQCRASAVWWRSAGGVHPSALVACNVQELRWKKDGKKEFLNASTPSQWLRWDEKDGIDSASGDCA